nr:ribonuclease H-like domain-containing protein [Tanacetum cinerariifolium]
MNDDDIEEMDKKWNLTLLSMRTDRPTPSIDVSKSVSKEQEERWKSNHPSFFEQGGSSGNVMPKPMIKFVKEFDCPNATKVNNTETNRKPTMKYVEMYKNTSQSPRVRGNQKNWNNQKSQQLGKDFIMQNKACYNCGSFDHLEFNCNHNTCVDKGKTWTRVNHAQDNMKYTSTHKSMTPRALLLKSGTKPINRPFSTARPTLKSAQPKMTSFVKTTHSNVKRIFERKSAAKNKVWSPTVRPKIPTVGSKVPTAKPTVPADKGNKGRAVKASAHWIWKPKQTTSGQGLNFNGVLVTFKKYQYIDTQGRLNGCSRHMTVSISYLSEYEPFNGGCVSFGHERGKITGKGPIKTDKIKFENVYFVEELKYNLFSVSQIFDNNNSILFIDTECLVLGKDFKLVDDKHVLLRTPRQQNMYIIDLKNVFPHKNLTCLIAKALIDESMLCHRRLGHLNFKTMNKLVRSNLVKVTFWAEAVYTACYVQNKILVTKAHNKTPYELFNERSHAIRFLRPFGCHVMILNTLDLLGKFDAKGDEGYFVGYSLSSKAFRVFNKRTKKIEEDLHVDFLENKSIEKGTGPNWLFDIDTLTNSMNYVPVVVVGTSSTNISGTKEDVHQAVKEKEKDDAILYNNSSQKEQQEVNEEKEVPESSQNSNPTEVSSNDSFELASSSIVETKVPTGRIKLSRATILGNAMSFENRLEDFFGDTSNAVSLNEVEDALSNIKTAIQVTLTFILMNLCISILLLTLNYQIFNGKACFCDYHNMVAILEKTEHNTDFHEIVDFLEASHIRTIELFASMLVPQVEGSEHLSEPHHTPSAQDESLHHEQITQSPQHAQITSPEPIPQSHEQTTSQEPTIPSQSHSVITTPRRITIGTTRISQSKVPLPGADDTVFPLGDVRYGEAFPTDTSLDVGQDKENIAKTSAMPHEALPMVTSLGGGEGSMQQTLQKLMDICTSLQRQHSLLEERVQNQDLEITQLKTRIKTLEDNERRREGFSQEDAPNARGMDQGEDLLVRDTVKDSDTSADKGSDSTDEMSHVLGSLGAANILASGGLRSVFTTASLLVATASIDISPVVATARGSFPTAVIFTTASVATPATRDKEKWKMTKPEQPSKEEVLEQMSIQLARDLEGKFAQEYLIIREQDKRDAEIARIHAEKELEIMIGELDMSNKMIAKYLSEYEQAAVGLSHDKKIELINELLMYQRNLVQIKKY